MKKILIYISVIIIAIYFTSCAGGGRADYVAKTVSETGKTKSDSRVEGSASLASEEVTVEYSKSKKDKRAELKDGLSKEEMPVEGKDVKVQQPQRKGLLTAGEWNDNDNWDFWTGLMADSKWYAMQKLWKFHLDERISVQIKDKDGNLLNNVSVQMKNTSGKTLWEAKTDVFGKVELFPHAFSEGQEKMYISVTNSANKTYKFNDYKSENVFVIEENSIVDNSLEIMLVVDATGSMGDEIRFLKAELEDIIEETDKKMIDLKTKVGMVFYRDRGDQYVTRKFDFSENIGSSLSFLSKQSAGGGGDFEEAVEIGIQEALALSWNENAKTKLMFLILDAPPHNTAVNIRKLQNSVKLASKKGIKIIPIVASGINKETEFLMRFSAISTNGTYVFLTDDSGIGDSHLKPTTGKYDVEFLNDLMIRLILKYTGNKEA